jgi:hypothetical protein
MNVKCGIGTSGGLVLDSETGLGSMEIRCYPIKMEKMPCLIWVFHSNTQNHTDYPDTKATIYTAFPIGLCTAAIFDDAQTRIVRYEHSADRLSIKHYTCTNCRIYHYCLFVPTFTGSHILGTFIKFMRKRWAGHKQCIHNVSWQIWRQTTLGIRCRRYGNIIQNGEDRHHWRVLMNMVINLRVT